MSKRIVSTKHAPAAVGPYSQGVIMDGWLWTSGQVALDPASGKLVGSDAATQAERALENLARILAEGGSGLDRVVRTTVYLTSMDDFKPVNEVYARFFSEPYPARACVEVRRLPVGALVEIDAIARVG
ncbi:MAG TPA: RidA family protein [Candidatus Polarisedimenticolaceae bacterium]|nr:RidA family protein [Candidatus Polarisedimenticolaceae bacterium]